MAEINTTAGSNRHNKGVRSKKLSTRVDLTPMVDLGFLLITFFIFTTTMSEPTTMDLKMPADGPPMKYGESATLSVIPTAGNKVFYYHGEISEALQNGAYGFTSYLINNGIGDVIRQKQLAMDKNNRGSKKDLMLIIKPADASTYQNFVDILDEVLINDISRYAVTRITADEKILLNARNIVF